MIQYGLSSLFTITFPGIMENQPISSITTRTTDDGQADNRFSLTPHLRTSWNFSRMFAGGPETPFREKPHREGAPGLLQFLHYPQVKAWPSSDVNTSTTPPQQEQEANRQDTRHVLWALPGNLYV